MRARKPRLRPKAKSLPQAMREFLTPAVFKQVRKAASRRRRPRWDIHPLLYVLLLSTWCVGDSLPEKFEVARGFYVVCCPKRKRPGKSFTGFEKALAKLPMPVLRTLGAALRNRILAVFDRRLFCHGFIPLGCDGTQLECPRSAELERRLGISGKEGSAPRIWNTSIVHLTLGIPWSWRLGRGGKASERTHLMQMIPCDGRGAGDVISTSKAVAAEDGRSPQVPAAPLTQRVRTPGGSRPVALTAVR